MSETRTIARPVLPPDRFNLYARLVERMPEGWRWFQFSSADEDAPSGMVRVCGAVIPVNSKGNPQYRNRDKSTERTFFWKIDDVERVLRDHAASEGVCYRCWGSGQMWGGWSVRKGSWFKQCAVCGGSDDPQQP